MAVCPAVAACVLTYRETGARGVRKLLGRVFDQKKIPKLWYAPILLFMPGVMVLSYGIMRAVGTPLPRPRPPTLAAVPLFAALFVAAAAEVLGWSGYATDRLLSRWSALHCALVLGLIWAGWHAVPYVQAQRSAAWMGWESLNTVALRVLIVCLYSNTAGSVFAAILFHAMINVSWLMFPNFGSHYDPRSTSLITACAAAIVTLVFSSRTLARTPG